MPPEQNLSPEDSALIDDATRRRRVARQHHREVLVFAAIASILILLLEIQDGGRVAFRFLPNRPLPEACLSRRLLEVECPFCGLTRSLVLMSRGDLQRSFQMHRLGWLVTACVLFQFPYRVAALRFPPGTRSRCDSSAGQNAAEPD